MRRRALAKNFVRTLLLLASFAAAACAPGMGGGPGNPGGGDDVMPGPDAGGGGPVVPPGGKGRIIGYFAAWGVYGRNYQVADIPADLLTHINYAFANVSGTGDVILGDSYADTDKFYPGDTWDAGALRGSFHQLQILKAAHPGLETIISIGGWSWSAHFSDVALTPESRAHFAQSAVDFIVKYGFDGIDIDWEYPGGGGLDGNVSRPEDGHNYTLLLGAIRTALSAQSARDGHTYRLTIAAPAGPSHIANLEVAQMHGVLDWINIMSYDFHGGWEMSTGHNAPLHADPADPTAANAPLNGDTAVQAYLAAGVPAEKLVLGVPFYGRGWSGVANVNNGLYQPSTGLPMGSWEAGVFDYKDLVANYLPKMQVYRDEAAGVPWLYDPATQVMISYDDTESFGKKTDYINAEGLGGAMFWELSGDTADHALLGVLHSRLTP